MWRYLRYMISAIKVFQQGQISGNLKIIANELIFFRNCIPPYASMSGRIPQHVPWNHSFHAIYRSHLLRRWGTCGQCPPETFFAAYNRMRDCQKPIISWNGLNKVCFRRTHGAVGHIIRGGCPSLLLSKYAPALVNNYDKKMGTHMLCSFHHNELSYNVPIAQVLKQIQTPLKPEQP